MPENARPIPVWDISVCLGIFLSAAKKFGAARLRFIRNMHV